MKSMKNRNIDLAFKTFVDGNGGVIITLHVSEIYSDEFKAKLFICDEYSHELASGVLTEKDDELECDIGMDDIPKIDAIWLNLEVDNDDFEHSQKLDFAFCEEVITEIRINVDTYSDYSF